MKSRSLKSLALILIFLPACASFWKDTRPGVVDCGKQEVREIVLQILPDITLLLATAGTGWPQLVQEKLKDAGEYSECVLQAAIAGLQQVAPGGQPNGPSTGPVTPGPKPQWPPQKAAPAADASMALFCALAEGNAQPVPADCAALTPRAKAIGRARALLK